MLKRRLLSGAVLLLLSGLVAKPAAAESILDQIADKTPLKIVSSELKDFANTIIEDAGREGRHLLQQGAMEVLIALQNLDSILKEQQDYAWGRLDRTIQDSFRQVDRRLQSLEDGLLRYEDFLYLDITSLMDRIPLLKGEKTLRSVQGISQAYKRSGAYRFELLGSAFGPAAETVVKIGGITVPTVNLESPRANQLRMSVPVERLNPSFQEAKIALMPLEVTVLDKRMRAWWLRLLPPFESHELVEVAAYRFPIRLLPRTAGNYSLVELQKTKVPSELAVWSQWGPTWSTSRIGHDCCKGCNCAKKASICAVIPKDVEVVEKNGLPVVDHWEGGECNEWCGWYDQPHIEAGKVCQVWGNWRKSHGGSARLRFQYRVLKDSTVRTRRTFGVVGETGEVERLEFGRLYEAELSPEYASYNLVLKLFNGEEVVVTPPVAINAELVHAELDFLGGTGQRLLLRLGGA